MNTLIQEMCTCYFFIGVCELNGKIYCIGGWNGQVGIKQCDVYDPDTNQWTSIAPLQTGKTINY